MSHLHPIPVSIPQGIGEPPLCLAISVLAAIKQAIYSARADEIGEEMGLQKDGKGNHFRLDSPSTAERIRMACTDRFIKSGCMECVCVLCLCACRCVFVSVCVVNRRGCLIGAIYRCVYEIKRAIYLRL